ncbi:Hydrogenase expression/formation protein HoxM [Frankliniella fusca]|uniref:Hydrogenase expression/formation protein HoxM n=1 Tax=Frankliniella fusca TaxID=407009 RepID=A0AAE1HEP1_9NEOP|nr:Hydrogenase expression/formation protein HoxM [Frankliniella fusca]
MAMSLLKLVPFMRIRTWSMLGFIGAFFQVKWDEAFKNMMCMKILIRLIKIVLATYLHSSNNVLLLYLYHLFCTNKFYDGLFVLLLIRSNRKPDKVIALVVGKTMWKDPEFGFLCIMTLQQ